MRVTKRDRSEELIQDWSHHTDSLFHWGRTKRCDKCLDDVRDEPMFRKRVFTCGSLGGSSNSWYYLCRTCAPDKKAAIKHWDG